MSRKVKFVYVDLTDPVPLDADGNVIPEEDEETEVASEITKLRFRKMRAKDMLATEGREGKVEASYAIYASMSGQDVSVIGELCADDLETVTEKVAPLMGKQAKAMIDAENQSPVET